MRFVKMHGTGNDFILFDAQNGVDLAKLAGEAPRLCDRRFGIGSDGILVVAPFSGLLHVETGPSADFRMVMYNPDGSEGMCGNGLRCFAKYLYENGRTRSTDLRIETVGGIVEAGLTVENGTVTRVRVNMGPPRLTRGQMPMLGDPDEQATDVTVEAAGQTFQATCVSMGNPHCVIFREDVDAVPLEVWGPAIETHPLFPERTNVEFVQVLSPGVDARLPSGRSRAGGTPVRRPETTKVGSLSEVRVRVWERGAGATLACGTGACASVVAGHLLGRCHRQVTVHMPGGDLEVEWAEVGNVYLCGPAVTVFMGEVEV